MRRLVYFEPMQEGHCAYWARFVLDAATHERRYDEVVLATGPAIAGALADLAAGRANLRVRVLAPAELAALSGPGLARKGLAEWKMAKSLMREHGATACFLPFFDHALLGAATGRHDTGGARIGGIVFRPPNDYNLPRSAKSVVDRARRVALYRAATRSSVVRLFTLDDTAANPSGRGPLHYLPDPAPDLAVLSSLVPRPRPDGRVTYLLFGSIASRKGIFVLLEALGRLPAARQCEIAIRIVGRSVSDEAEAVRAAVAKARAAAPELALEVEDRFVSDAELAAEVINAGVVLAPYQNHRGSSGVIYWAAAARRPILSQRTGLMGSQIARHGLGLALDTTDAAALAAAIAGPVPVIREAGAAEFLAEHTGEAFAACILDGLTP